METKEEILKNIRNSFELEKNNNEKNLMGISESFYDPYYLIGKCFLMEELDTMTEEELYNLLVLARYATDIFY